MTYKIKKSKVKEKEFFKMVNEREPPLNKCSLCGSKMKWYGKTDEAICENKKCEMN